jgi:hypothetical protein
MLTSFAKSRVADSVRIKGSSPDRVGDFSEFGRDGGV